MRGVQALLDYYVPALFVLGHDVRELTWQGRAGGTVKGNVARRVLQRSLLLQVHLLQDWECRAEYSRTLSIALLQWQPWMSSLPGCCFVEESCEALLSRMVGRCRANTNLTDVEDILRLFVTLPLPVAEPKGTTGCIRQQLVSLLRSRMERILQDADSQPFAEVLSAREARWKAAMPGNLRLPTPPSGDRESASLHNVMRGALVSLTAPARVTDDVRTFMDTHVPLVQSDTEKATREGALARVRSWGAERRQRQRDARQSVADVLGSQDMGRDLQQQDMMFDDVDASRARAPDLGSAPVADEPQLAQGSRDASQYEAPDEAVVFSEGYHSYGDTDSLGSAGLLVDYHDSSDEGPEESSGHSESS